MNILTLQNKVQKIYWVYPRSFLALKLSADLTEEEQTYLHTCADDNPHIFIHYAHNTEARVHLLSQTSYLPRYQKAIVQKILGREYDICDSNIVSIRPHSQSRSPKRDTYQ